MHSRAVQGTTNKVGEHGLSVMAYDYPTEKISIYVFDDGGSQLTLFACMEAAKFASHWLPFSRKTKIIDRSPEAYFASNHSWSSDAEKIKVIVLSKTFAPKGPKHFYSCFQVFLY